MTGGSSDAGHGSARMDLATYLWLKAPSGSRSGWSPRAKGTRKKRYGAWVTTVIATRRACPSTSPMCSLASLPWCATPSRPMGFTHIDRPMRLMADLLTQGR